MATAMHWGTEDGEIRCWIDSGIVCLKAVTASGDPVELSEHELIDLIAALTDRLAAIR